MRSLQLHGLYRDMLLYGSNGESNGQESGIMDGVKGEYRVSKLSAAVFWGGLLQ